MRFASLPVLAKLAVAPAAGLVVLALLAGLGGSLLHVQHAEFEKVYAEVQPRMVRALRLPNRLARIRADLYKYSVLRSIGVPGAEVSETEFEVRAALALAEADLTAFVAEDPENAAEVQEAFRRYRAAADQSLTLMSRNPTLGASLLHGSETPYRQIAAMADRYADRHLAIAYGTSRSSYEKSGRLIVLFGVLAGLAGLVLLVTSTLVSRAIVRPVRGIIGALRALRNGDLDTAVPYAGQRDELGEMARAVGEFGLALQRNRSLEQEREKRRAELEYQSRHDGLTGLANRQALQHYLQQAVDGARQGDGDIAFLLLDLDGFKAVNDAYGHAAGDAVLVGVAGRLSAVLRADQGLVARLGGDEFGVVLARVGEMEQVEPVIRRLLADIPQPVGFEGKELCVGVSIGAALLRETGGVDELLAAADQAMYQAKQDREPSWRRWEPDAAADHAARRRREEIAAALQGRQFLPHYQPIFDLASGERVGFEAFARWQHPVEGLLMPGAFLPGIESLGLQGDFTFLIARQVCTDLSAWLAAGLRPGRVAINVAESILATESGLQDFEWLLAEHPAVAGHLTLEITESVFLARSAELIRTNAARLAARGVRISLDDFGTGHASFRHLRQFPVDELKIDMEFVAGIGRDPAAEVIITGLLAIATGLSADTVAEGVETAAQAAFMRARGCLLAQGHFFGTALAADQVRETYLDPAAARRA